jgi:hypothetical protein
VVLTCCCRAASTRRASPLPPRATQIHDELLFEVSAPHLHTVAAMVQRAMEGCREVWGLRLPLTVKMKAGPSWGQCTPYEVPEGTAGAAAAAAAVAAAAVAAGGSVHQAT